MAITDASRVVTRPFDRSFALAVFLLALLTFAGAVERAGANTVAESELRTLCLVAAGLLMVGASIDVTRWRTTRSTHTARLGLFIGMCSVAVTARCVAPDVFAPESTAITAIVVAACCGASVLLFRRAHALATVEDAWVGLLCLSLASAELINSTNAASGHTPAILPSVITIVGAMFVVRGAEADLRGELEHGFEAMTQIRSLDGLARTRSHASRNALTAIRGAVETLDRYHDALPPETRRRLVDGVSMEVERLQEIVAPDDEVAPWAPAS